PGRGEARRILLPCLRSYPDQRARQQGRQALSHRSRDGRDCRRSHRQQDGARLPPQASEPRPRGAARTMSRSALRISGDAINRNNFDEFLMTDDVLSVLLDPIYLRLQDVAVPVGAAGSEYILFVSYTDGHTRARVETFRGPKMADVWRRGTARLRKVAARTPDDIHWLRIDSVDEMRQNDWRTLQRQLTQVKPNYCRQGISLAPTCRHAFLETEINANAM